MSSLTRCLTLIFFCPALLAQQASYPRSVSVPAHPIVQQAPHDPATSSLIMEPMPLVAPLVIEDRSTSSVLTLVNNGVNSAGATISTRNLQGTEIGRQHVLLTPHEDRHIPIASLISASIVPAKYGSISVLQDSDLKGPAVAAQLLITDNWNTTPAYFDEELAMPDMMHGSPPSPTRPSGRHLSQSPT